MKSYFNFLFCFVAFLLWGAEVHAQSGMESTATQAVIDFIWPFIEGNKVAVILTSLVGALRFVFKPAISALKAFTEFTPYDKDDEFLAKVQESKVYKAVAWVADLVVSIKLPKKTK